MPVGDAAGEVYPYYTHKKNKKKNETGLLVSWLKCSREKSVGMHLNAPSLPS